MTDRSDLKLEAMMNVARSIATLSTCSRLNVGAVVTVSGRIVATGYNGPPAGMPHCDHTMPEPDLTSDHAVHAEANAVAFAARSGVALKGGVVYCTDSPCLSCAQLLVNAGIEQVWYERPYRKREGLDLLNNLGIETSRWRRRPTEADKALEVVRMMNAQGMRVGVFPVPGYGLATPHEVRVSVTVPGNDDPVGATLRGDRAFLPPTRTYTLRPGGFEVREGKPS